MLVAFRQWQLPDRVREGRLGDSGCSEVPGGGTGCSGQKPSAPAPTAMSIGVVTLWGCRCGHLLHVMAPGETFDYGLDNGRVRHRYTLGGIAVELQFFLALL